jgi:hypothetical protein
MQQVTLNKTASNVTLAEEKAAADAEKKRDTKPISAAGLKRVQRVHELKEIMAPYLAEIEEHRAKIFAEMDKQGVDVLTRRGVEVVSRDRVESEQWDKKGIASKFPEIVVEFVKEKISYRVNWKNPFHQ